MAASSALRPSLSRVFRQPKARTIVSSPVTAWSAAPGNSSASPFSTTSAQCKRKTRDNNRLRGMSALRRSGVREPLSVSGDALPKPADYKPVVQTPENHGLWGFFPEKDKLINTPDEDSEYGRAWMVQELRQKSWEDLHALWWACCRERNMIATANAERQRLGLGFGEHEAQSRDEAVWRTMKAIKHTLTERYYLWEDAHQLAQEDPEIDLSGEGDAYTPQHNDEYMDDYMVEEADAEANAQGEAQIDPSLPQGQKASEQAPRV